MAVRTRRAQVEDAADLRRIARAAYARYIPRMGREPPPMRADFDEAIAAAEVWVAVAGESEDAGETVVGYVVSRMETDHVLIENLAVEPSAQGAGAGSLLLEKAENAARERGLGLARLYTHRTMVENIALYGRRGYRETHREAESGFGRVFFEKKLATDT